MKRFSIILLLILASCSKIPGAISLRRGDTLDRNIHPEKVVSTGSFAPDTTGDSPVFEDPEISPRIYACGVERPESASPAFVVFEDGERIIEYELGVPAVDADSHYLVGRDMYVTATEGQMTTVYKNGEKLFTYKAREYVTFLISRADGVWTLGLDRGGDGFALRHDGVQVFAKAGGIPGRLYQDSGHLYFDYAITMGEKKMRYLVKEGEAISLTSPSGGELRAVTVSEDDIWYLEDCPEGWLLSCGKESYKYRYKSSSTIKSAVLYGRPGGCAAVIDLGKTNGLQIELVCSGEKMWTKVVENGSYYYYDCAPDMYITFTRNAGELSVCEFGGELQEMIEGVRLEGGRCAMQYDGQIYLACTPMDGSPPFIWKRGNMRMAIDLQGYLTGIFVSAPD